MTTRRGSIGGDLSAAPTGADAAGAAAEDQGAERGDEPQLRAMRAVWLAMRDEAPPERGLAELLAAARQKAEAMQPTPTPWQRLFAALRRPPVLALATAMVLIGGGVLIGHRAGAPASAPVNAAREPAGGPRGLPAEELGDRARLPAPGGGDAPGAMPEAAAAARTAPPSATPGALGSGGSSAPVESVKLRSATRQEVTTESAVHTARSKRPAVERPAPPRTEVASQRPAASPAAPTRVPSRAPRSKDDVVGGESRSKDDVVGGESKRRDLEKKAAERVPVLRGSPSPPPRAHPGAAGSSGSPGDEPPPVADRAPADRGAGESTGEGPEAEAAPPQAQPPRATPAQLYEQCESAARRGDCVAVRRIVDQITRTDLGYRGRIAKTSTVAKCLAE